MSLCAVRYSYLIQEDEYFGPKTVADMYIGMNGRVVESGIFDAHDLGSPKAIENPEFAKHLLLKDREYAKRILHVLSMLNCQNITTVSGGFTDDGIGKKRRIKERRPHIEYKVLRVQTGKHKFQILGRATGGESMDLPLHTVRGHFATYTEDRPMFGRPGEYGRYWVPSHTRGSRKHGEVKKVYEVTA